MKKYKYQNGLENVVTRSELPAILSQTVSGCSYVATVDGETFYTSSVYNDSKKPCYKVVMLRNGERRNVNMNNGIAYKTTL